MKEKLKKIKVFFGFGKSENKGEILKKKAQWELRASKSKVAIFVIAIMFEIGFFYYMAKAYGMLDVNIKSGDKIAVIDFNKQVTQDYVNKVIAKMESIYSQ